MDHRYDAVVVGGGHNGLVAATLRARAELERIVGDDAAWGPIFERPLGELLEATFAADLTRGVALTDGVIGTFASENDPQLRQNRCFLYHVVGNGTGDWDVPVGGMGAVTEGLAAIAWADGAEVRLGVEVTGVETDGVEAVVRFAGGEVRTRRVLANVAPAVLA